MKINPNNRYEYRVDGEKVAAYCPLNDEMRVQALDMVEKTRFGLYRDKVLQVVAVRGDKEEIILEEHPTVMEDV